MSETVIKVENLSKQYQLGQVGTGTLTRDLQRWYSRIRGKEDPTLKIGQENILSAKGSHKPQSASRTPDFVWALKDINFEVKQGEVLGIIGKNGAGKSTLLKILSQVTSPTTGEIKVKGRIASLLEVGTGFHPELTGRENVFLNGAILGMTKAEIKSKFDEIVDFSGVEKYIDTPVKRYSSGMYVRLAFAVAAHLEPEILVVDEVLAVGDAEFQKKALGKMQDVSCNEGRTVLFVSHNMNAVKHLCFSGIVLKNGIIDQSGLIDKCLDHYNNQFSEADNHSFFNNRIILGGEMALIKNVLATFDTSTRTVGLQMHILCLTNLRIKNIGVGINFGDMRITTVESQNEGMSFNLSKGENTVYCEIPVALNPGRYSLLFLLESFIHQEDYIDDRNILLEVPEYYIFNKPTILSKSQGNLLINAKWRI